MNLEKSNLFKIYFNLMKFVLVVTAIVLVRSQLQYFEFGSFIMSSVGLSVIAIQFFAIFKAEKLIKERKFLGTIIGLGLSILSLGGPTLPLGIFGIYALINKDFLKEFKPDDTPAWFEDNIVNSKLFN